MLDPLEALGPDARIPAATLFELLRGAIAITGDEALGLRAARRTNLGDYDVLEWAASTCRTGREAIEVVGRYIRLINDVAEVSYREHGERDAIVLGSSVPLPRAAADFYVATFHVSGRHRSGPVAGVEVCFTHPEPAYRKQYEETFRGARLTFDAAFNGFIVDRALMQRTLDSADEKLNQVLRRHADALLSELPKAESLTQRVRALIASTLPRGASAEQAARTLHMSRRSLTRHLEREGTTFRELLDDMRRRMAIRYLENTELASAEIGFLLGFAHVGAFHRAFKRWSELTPLEYRRSKR
jgi:AraC-like DNA-binding protein